MGRKNSEVDNRNKKTQENIENIIDAGANFFKSMIPFALESAEESNKKKIKEPKEPKEPKDVVKKKVIKIEQTKLDLPSK